MIIIGHRNKKYHQEKQKRLEEFENRKQARKDAPIPPFCITLPIGAKKAGAVYDIVPIWKVLLAIGGFLLAVFLLILAFSASGYSRFFAFIILHVVAIVFMVVCFIIFPKNKERVGAFLLIIFFICSLIMNLVDLPYINNPEIISLSNCTIEVTRAGYRGVETYKLIGYTPEGERVVLTISENQGENIRSNLVVSYLPNSKTVVDINPVIPIS